MREALPRVGAAGGAAAAGRGAVDPFRAGGDMWGWMECSAGVRLDNSSERKLIYIYIYILYLEPVEE